MMVGELIEDLRKFPSEMRLKLVVEAIDGDCNADDVDLRRSEDVIELKVSGALVKNLIAEGERD